MALNEMYKLRNQDNIEIIEILASIYYNKATCLYKLLSEKLSNDYYLATQGYIDFNKFKPLEIIDYYLKC